MELRYFDIAWFSKVDGPGNRVVLYLQGCNLACPWCHSPHSRYMEAPILFSYKRCIKCNQCVEVCESAVHKIEDGVHRLYRDRCTKCGKCIDVCPTSSHDNTCSTLVLPTKAEDTSAIFKLLLPQLEVLKTSGGLTLSGGEALLQKEAALEILRRCKLSGVHTAVETSLTLPKSSYEYVSEYVDCWLIGMRDTDFNNSKGNITDEMAKNINFISSLNKEIIIRLPIIKGFTDSKVQLERINRLMNLGKFINIQLLPCNKDMEHYYKLAGLNLPLVVSELCPSEAEIAVIIRFFEFNGFNVKVVW